MNIFLKLLIAVAIFVWLLLLAIAIYPPLMGDRFILGEDVVRHNMVNCGNPDGLIVIETGRVIEIGEEFEMLGEEIVDDDGMSEIRVYDGTVRREDMFICEVVSTDD